jgi:hypothetical protein
MIHIEKSKYRTLLVKENKPTKYFWLYNKLYQKYNNMTMLTSLNLNINKKG